MTISESRPTRFPPNGITALMTEPRAYDLAESISLDLTLGEVLDAGAIAALAQVRLDYGTVQGGERLRGLLGSRLGVPADQVMVTPGGVWALHALALELCASPGDEAVVLTPCFPPAVDTVRAAGAHVKLASTTFERGYRAAASDIEPHVTERTRLVSICTPGNPHGVEVGRSELEAISAMLADRAPGAVLLIDETYREASLGDRIAPTHAGMGGNVVVCSSLSKAHGTPGLRVGWMTVPGHELMQRLIRVKMNTVISVSGLCETIADVVIEKADRILAKQRAHLLGGFSIMQRFIEDHRELVDWVKPDAGALCCLRPIDDKIDRAALDRELKERGVLVGRGGWFGDDERVIRIGFGAMPNDRFREGLAQFGESLRSAHR